MTLFLPPKTEHRMTLHHPSILPTQPHQPLILPPLIQITQPHHPSLSPKTPLSLPPKTEHLMPPLPWPLGNVPQELEHKELRLRMNHWERNVAAPQHAHQSELPSKKYLVSQIDNENILILAEAGSQPCQEQ